MNEDVGTACSMLHVVDSGASLLNSGGGRLCWVFLLIPSYAPVGKTVFLFINRTNSLKTIVSVNTDPHAASLEPPLF